MDIRGGQLTCLLLAAGMLFIQGVTAQERITTRICGPGWMELGVGIDPNLLQQQGLIFCMRVFRATATWQDSQTRCHDNGGHLLVLERDWFGIPMEAAVANIRDFALEYQLGPFWTSIRAERIRLWWKVGTPMPVRTSSSSASTWLWVDGQPSLEYGGCGEAMAQSSGTAGAPLAARLVDCDDQHPSICINKGIGFQAMEVPHCDEGWLGSIHMDTCVQYGQERLDFSAAQTGCESRDAQLVIPTDSALNNLTSSAILQPITAFAPTETVFECYVCASTMNLDTCFTQTEVCLTGDICETMVLSTPRGNYYSMACVPEALCGNRPSTAIQNCQDGEECSLASTCCQESYCNEQLPELPSLGRAKRQVGKPSRSREAELDESTSGTSWIGGEIEDGDIAWVDGTSTNFDDSRLADGYQERSGCLGLDPNRGEGEEWVVMGCQAKLPYVCEKPANPGPYPVSITEHPSNLWSLVSSLSYNVGGTSSPSLHCGAKNYDPTREVVWVKDGYYLGNGNPAEGGLELLLDYELAGQLPYVTNQFTMAIMQGYYQCQVWGYEPMQTVQSRPALVKFYDVVTLQVELRIPSVSFTASFTRESLLNINPSTSDTMYGTLLSELFAIRNIELYPHVAVNGYSEGSLVVSATAYFTVVPGTLEYIWQLIGETDPYTQFPPDYVAVHLESWVYSQLMDQLPGRLNGSDRSSWFDSYGLYGITLQHIEVRGTVTCPEMTVMFESRSLQMPVTAMGTMGQSTEVCYSDGVATAEAFCMGNFTSGAYWGPVEFHTSCANPPTSDVTPELVNLAQEEVTRANALDVAQDVSLLTEDAAILQPVDVMLTADILEHIAAVPDLTDDVGSTVLSSVSHIMEVSDSVLIESQTINQATTRILTSIETYASTCNASGTSIVQPRVTMQVLTITETLETSGFLVSGAGGELFDENNVNSISGDSSNISDTSVAVQLSPEVMEIAQQAQVEWQELLDRTYDPQLRALIEANPVRLSFKAYQNAELFLTPSQLDMDAEVVHGSGSMVVAATLHGYGVSVQNLTQPISTTFYPSEDPLDYIAISLQNVSESWMCAFWDFSANGGLGNWSTEGCWLEGIEDGRVTCSCDHLTNFAILTDIQRGRLSDADRLALSIITIIGLSLSIVGLGLTVISYILFRKLRKGRSHQVLFNLALALLCVYIIFLAGIEQTQNRIGCMVVAALLHYFLLVAFAWMLVEGVTQYLMFAKVFDTYVEKFMWKAGLPAWGLPAVAVAAVAGVDYNMFRGPEEYCWLEITAFYFAFLIPVCLVIVVNSVLYIIVIRSITCGRSNIRSSQSEKDVTLLQLRASITCFVVLGITWLFGFLALEEANIVFQYLFCIFNSFQGFLIFVLHVMRERAVRDSWRQFCCPGMETGQKYSSTNSESQGTKSTGVTSVHKTSVQYDNINLRAKKTSKPNIHQDNIQLNSKS